MRLDGSEQPRLTPQERLPVNPRRQKVAPERRKRVATACNACNVRRVKCSGDRPCRQCQSSGRDCMYPTPVEKVSVSRDELEELRRKAAQYEAALLPVRPEENVPGAHVPGVHVDSDPVANTRKSHRPTLPSDAGHEPASTGPAPPNDGMNASRSESPSTHQAASSQGAQLTNHHLAPHSYPFPHQSHLYPTHPQRHAPPSLPSVSHRSSASPSGYSTRFNLPNRPIHANSFGQEQESEDQAPTEGRLLHDIDGHARFLGESSGATFLDYLKEFMRNLLPLTYRQQNHQGRPGADGTAFLSSLGRYQTYDSRPLHDRDVDPLWLPPRPEMEAMLSELRCFIQDGNGAWPSGGIYWWGDLSSSPSPPQAPAPSQPLQLDSCRHLSFYHTAFAVLSQSTIVPANVNNIDAYPSEFFYTRARILLGNPLDITRFRANEVGALALMGFYLVEMNRRDAAYMCVSNAMHISIMHGAHRGWVDESGKRVFWTLYVLDRYLSCLMGRPPTIMDDAIRLPLPCDSPSLPPAAGLSAHVELARISGHVVCNTYRVSPYETRKGHVGHLEDAIAMLDEWQANLPSVLRLSESGLSNDPATCLLHMEYNQLVILSIRPVFFAAVKKTFAERLVTRNPSIESHPQLVFLKRCVEAAEFNIRLARHIVSVNQPRKLLQAGLHFIFNAAICLMLQELIYSEGRASQAVHLHDEAIDFVLAQFEAESRIGSNYGRDCATVLRDLRVLVQRLRVVPTVPNLEAVGNEEAAASQQSPYVVPESGASDEGGSWQQKTSVEGLQQPIYIDETHTLYPEIVSWIVNDWHTFDTFAI